MIYKICKSLSYYKHTKFFLDRLGSGTGLVGIATATLWKVPVVLTDLPEIQENLEFNVKLNLDTIQKSGGIASCSVLDWKSSDSALQALDLGIFEVSLHAVYRSTIY